MGAWMCPALCAEILLPTPQCSIWGQQQILVMCAAPTQHLWLTFPRREMQTTLLGHDQGRAWTFLWMLAALIQAVCKWDGPVASRTWHMEGLLGLQ